MATLIDAMNAEIMKPCDCKREKAIYFCSDKSCPAYTQRQFYCLFCFEEDLHPNHKPVRVNKVVDEYKQKWITYKKDLADLVIEAAKIQEPFKCLIHMSEKLMISAQSNQLVPFKSLTRDFETLAKQSKDFADIYSQPVYELILNCELLEIFKYNDWLERAQQALE